MVQLAGLREIPVDTAAALMEVTGPLHRSANLILHAVVFGIDVITITT